MAHQISAEDKKELDQFIDTIGEAVMNIASKLQELNIKTNIEWLQTIHTIIDSGANINQLAFFDGDRAYQSWVNKRLEVCEDRSHEFEITDDIVGIEFYTDDGECQKVCLECGEGVLINNVCSHCG